MRLHAHAHADRERGQRPASGSSGIASSGSFSTSSRAVADRLRRPRSACAGPRAAAFCAASTSRQRLADRLGRLRARPPRSRRFSSRAKTSTSRRLRRQDLALGRVARGPAPPRPRRAVASTRGLLALEPGLLPLEPGEERLGLLLLVVAPGAGVGDDLGRQAQPLGHLEGEAAAGGADGEPVGGLVASPGR